MTADAAEAAAIAQAIDWLGSHIDYERRDRAGLRPAKLSLDSMTRLLAELGDPHLETPAVHIAGTKGKGSTAAMAEALLRGAGLKTGLVVSPHLADVRERMQIDRRFPADAVFLAAVEQVRHACDRLADDPANPLRPTFFELTTALAWLVFAAAGCDVAVVEVGLGGRLDSTNVCRPVATAIASISRDHVEILGDTLGQIAAEKAGIAKPGVPLFVGRVSDEPRDAINTAAATAGAPVHFLGDPDFRWRNNTATTPAGPLPDLPTPLVGDHQRDNALLAAAAALAACDALKISPDSTAMAAELARLDWPLRFEVFPDRRPQVVLDAAHNLDSLAKFAADLETFADTRPLAIVFGTSRDKPAAEMLAFLAARFPAANLVLTAYQKNPRAVPPEELAASASGRSAVAGTPAEALAAADRLAGSEGVVAVVGSFYLAAEARPLITTPPMARSGAGNDASRSE